MEENKKDELDVEVIDDELEDEDVEEYDFNDDEFIEEDEDEDEGEADEDGESDVDEEDAEEESEEKSEEESEEKPEEESEEKSETEEPEKKSEDAPADTGKGGDGKVDYNAKAADALKAINEEFGLELKNFNDFENIEQFAELCLDERYGPIKAFAATNHKLAMEGAKNKAKKEFASVLKPPSKDHIRSLPKGEGADTKPASDRISKREYMEMKALYPDMPKSEIVKVIRRVRKNTTKGN